MFVGSGKAEELRLACEANDIELVIFNHALAPAQQRNLEQALNRRVIDRTSLILDIFAQRARSHEGKLQVELAQLQYLSTRLIRAWTHLERQKGGIGLRGPGETQLETDRRLIGERIKALKTRLEETAPSARHAASRAQPQSDDVGVAGRLYERGQIHALQRADESPGVCRRPVVRHARYHLAPRLSRRRSGAGGGVRYGRFHPRIASPTGRGIPRHARGNHSRRSAAACGRRVERRARSTRSIR